MFKRGFLLAALVASFGLAAAGWLGWWKTHLALTQLAFPLQRLAFLAAETQRLQTALSEEQAQLETLDLVRRRQEIESTVQRLRSLSFIRPVTYREIPRSELPKILQAKLSQQIPDQEFARTGVAFAALGLIPAGTDLKKTYLGLLGEQVGAFYDQHSQELFTFTGHPLASSQNQVVLAHELTHALEDQHFNLLRLPLEAKGNDDRALAASALVEGDATLVMNRYLLGALSAAAIRESLGAAVTTDVHQLAAAPRFLRETLLFPYLQGQEFCQQLYDHGGWPELARAFAHPPASTSEILHPDRFLADPREEPVSVTFARTDVLGKPPIADNVLGEFGVRQWLLRSSPGGAGQAPQIAAGLQGDRYLVYGDEHAASLVWETVWRSAAQAEAFQHAAAETLGSSAAGPVSVSAQDQPGRRGKQLTSVSSSDDKRRILIVSAADPDTYAALREQFEIGFKLPP